MSRFQFNKGTYCLLDLRFDSLEVADSVVPAAFQAQARKRDGPRHRHCTLLDPTHEHSFHASFPSLVEDHLGVGRPGSTDSRSRTEQLDLVLVGVGRARNAYFCVLSCPDIQLLRARAKLPWKDLHVTLGFDGHDAHGPEAYKGPASVFAPLVCDKGNQERVDAIAATLVKHWRLLANFDQTRPALIRFCLELSSYALSIASHEYGEMRAKLLNFRAMVHFAAHNYAESYADAVDACSLTPTIESIARLADSAWKVEDYETCLVASWKLYLTDNAKATAHAWILLKRLWNKSIVNLEVIEASKVASGMRLTAEETRKYKGARFSLLDHSASIEENHTLAKSKVQLNNSHRLPRRFSWVVPLLLAGMSTPKCIKDLAALKSLGIVTVITLTEEEPLPKAWFEENSMTNYFWPVTNYCPPAIAHADRFNQLLLQHMHEKKGGILVHCGGGIGRAGSLLATYLIRYGLNAPPPVCTRCETRMPIHCDDTECALGMAPTMSAKDAIELLRSIRPQSIETTHQENFLSDFASELFRRAGTQTRLFSPLDVPSDAQPGQIRFTGERTPSPQVLILCGLPASGKSYFTSTLLASSAKWVSVSQDETGSLEACEREAGTLAAEVGTKCVVVDRCNPTAKERAAWIKLLGTPRGAVLVHFDADKESCVERASYRLAHPTVRANAAKSVVSSFAARFEKPTQSTEHKAFQAIYTVSSFADSISLLSHFGIKVPDDAAPAGFVKYPRTRHLFDLGAASRDDLILSDTETFLSAAARDPEAIFTIEEKVDGANVGFRLNSDGVKIIAQNRTHIVTSASHAQFAGLGAWVFRNQDALHRILAKGCILFGEWMVARHSVSYDLLPDVFVAFDIYDIREARFYSRMRFDAALEGSGISKVPRVDVSHLGMVTKEDLLRLIEEWSSFSSTERREGLVLRLDKQDHLMSKAKVVRPDFICGNDHWSKGIIEKNKIAWG